MTKTVQDLMISDLLEFNDNEQSNETVQLLEFMRLNGTPLAKHQLEAMLLLHETGLSDIANLMNNSRQFVTSPDHYFKTIDKLTLADRIKGNAKLSHLMKASDNPASTALSAKDMQAQGMKRSEIDR